MDLLDALKSIETGQHASNWREAIRLAGKGLTESGATTEAYTEEMIEALEQNGPYIVIAPGLALAHSRPSPAVLRPGLSWVGLAEPVEFGHAANDPVRLVIGLAALDHDAHLQVMSTLAIALSDETRLERLLEASSPGEVRALLADASGD